MRHFIRKTTPRTARGKESSRPRAVCLMDSPIADGKELPMIVRERPGQGFRHVLKQRDVELFISLLPNWDELSEGLHTILLAEGEEECDGWHIPGMVAVCAWERGLWRLNTEYDYEQDRELLDRLEVPIEQLDRKRWVCKFEEASVRGFQLLRVLLHELGHHHDQMNTRSKKQPSRGEPYAEAYARNYEKRIWDRYLEVFGLYG